MDLTTTEEHLLAILDESYHSDFTQAVSEGEYPTGEVDLNDLSLDLPDLPRGRGSVRWTFSAEHPKEAWTFRGVVTATIAFNANASSREELSNSLIVSRVVADFDQDDRDPPDDDSTPSSPPPTGDLPF